MRIKTLSCKLAWLAAGLLSLEAAAQGIPNIPTTHPRILLVGAEVTRLRANLNQPTAAATRFKNRVDSAVFNGANIYDYKPWYSALIGVLVQNQPAYCNDAIARIDAFLDEEAVLIANRAGAEPINPELPQPLAAADSYLEVGDAVGNVALVYDWCNSTLTTAQRTRWGNYGDRFVANIWDPDSAQWGVPNAGNNYSWSGIAKPWNGWSINNPVNNYYYSFLRATMLHGIAFKHERPAADGFLTTFRTTKIQNQLVPTFTNDLVGGGSREGTGYGTAMKGLFGLYHLWEKSTGERLSDLTPHAAATMPYMLHALAPTRNRLAPIGDHARDETATFYDYQREMLMALSTIYAGTPMANRVRETLPLTNVPIMQDAFNMVWDFLYDGAASGASAQLNTSYYGAGTGHLFTRSSWETNATWLTFLTGAYSESHAHQDGLSLMLYKNGWLVNDANMRAHSGIWQGQDAHGMVTQRLGGTYIRMYENPASKAQLRALSIKNSYRYFAADAGTLYNHPNTGNPGIRSEREIVYLPPDVVVVFDRANYTPSATLKTFQLPTPNQPVINGRTITMNNGTSTLNVRALQPAASTLAVTDMRNVNSDFQGGWRIDSSVTTSGLTRFLNVLSVDNAVSAATTGANEGSVTVTLQDGRQVTLQFNLDTMGGTIEIRNSSGQVLVSEALSQTVTVPSVLEEASALIVRNDFNDDGRSDILLRNTSTGENYLYPMNGTAIVTGEGYIRTVAAPWTLAGIGDFDGNGTADLLWRNTTTGENYVYFMNGTSIASEGYIRTVPLAWSIAGVADLDGDGRADILLRNTTTGENYLYPMDGFTIKANEGYIRIVPSPWTIAGLADFNNDGRADILLRNTTTGENYLYPMNGTAILAGEGYIRTVAAPWALAGIGDFDGNGTADLFWRNTSTGENYFYFMNGTAITSEGYVRTVPLAWSVASVSDFNGDGRADILLRNTTTGENYLYPMNGTAILGTEGYVRTVPTSWSIVSK
jgi:hypothetical protein